MGSDSCTLSRSWTISFLMLNAIENVKAMPRVLVYSCWNDVNVSDHVEIHFDDADDLNTNTAIHRIENEQLK
jgi:hypothetical protein